MWFHMVCFETLVLVNSYKVRSKSSISWISPRRWTSSFWRIWTLSSRQCLSPRAVSKVGSWFGSDGAVCSLDPLLSELLQNSRNSLAQLPTPTRA